jgi:CBS domain-containing protein
MAEVLKKASTPVITVQAHATVEEAVRIMVKRRIGAIVVLEGERMTGIFSERDVMQKVVLGRLDPATTLVASVMTWPVVAAVVGSDEAEAVDEMVERHIRHMPVVDHEDHVVGMLSFRHVMQDRIDNLKHEVNSLEAYLGYDGVSG